MSDFGRRVGAYVAAAPQNLPNSSTLFPPLKSFNYGVGWGLTAVGPGGQAAWDSMRCVSTGGKLMRILKVLIVALAALFAVSTVQAATFVKPGGKLGVESSVELTAKKKKAKKAAKKKKGTKVAKAGKAGKCGAYMYYKKGKCEDARKKK
jgi:hypothetical protein